MVSRKMQSFTYSSDLYVKSNRINECLGIYGKPWTNKSSLGHCVSWYYIWYSTPVVWVPLWACTSSHCLVWCQRGETHRSPLRLFSTLFLSITHQSYKVILLLPIYINKHPYHKPYSCQPQHSSPLIVVLRYPNPQKTQPQHHHNPLTTSRTAQTSLEKSKKSLLNKTIAFVLFVFHWNKGGKLCGGWHKPLM